MEILRGTLDTIGTLRGRRALTLGTFDGVHRGHRAILDHLAAAARAESLDGSAVVTFGPHPRAVLDPGRAPRLLTTLDERLEYLAEAEVDRAIVLEFDERLAATGHEDFVEHFLVRRLGLAHFVLGHDVHFGRDRGGNAVTVASSGERLGFTVSQVPSLRDDGVAISSTAIRDRVGSGDLDRAVRWLGHPFPLSGGVEVGRRLGRTLGFPTANLGTPTGGKMLPARGVYAGFARTEGGAVHPCVVNIGSAPTVDPEGSLRVEAHCLGFEGDLYGQVLQLALGHRLRPEHRFPSVEDLRAAIAADVLATRHWAAGAPRAARPLWAP